MESNEWNGARMIESRLTSAPEPRIEPSGTRRTALAKRPTLPTVEAVLVIVEVNLQSGSPLQTAIPKEGPCGAIFGFYFLGSQLVAIALCNTRNPLVLKWIGFLLLVPGTVLLIFVGEYAAKAVGNTGLEAILVLSFFGFNACFWALIARCIGSLRVSGSGKVPN